MASRGDPGASPAVPGSVEHNNDLQHANVRLPRDFKTWSALHVQVWLKRNDLGFVADEFRRLSVNGAGLNLLTDNDLRSMLVSTDFQRRRILVAISELTTVRFNCMCVSKATADSSKPAWILFGCIWFFLMITVPKII
jgi:hypothetical protein